MLICQLEAVHEAMEALNGQYQASYDGKAPKACVEKLHFGLWGEETERDTADDLLEKPSHCY